MKKIVLTGGPCSGKTSLLLALENQGEHVVREAATDWIMYKQASGVNCPWEEENFQLNILNLQKLHEERIHPDAKRVFLDRGRHDGLAYLNSTDTMYRKVLSGATECTYDLVFIIEPLDFIETTIIRRENRQEAEQLSKKVEEVYKLVGYDPIIIKKGKLHERVNTILQATQDRLGF